MPDERPDPARGVNPAPLAPVARGSRGSGGSVRTGVLVAAASIAALYFGQDILVPITLAMLLSFVLSPLMELLRKLWLGRVASALLAVLFAIAIMTGFGAVIGTEIAGFIGRVPQYQTTIDAKVSSLQTLVSTELTGLTHFMREVEGLGAGTPKPEPPGAAKALPSPPAPTPVMIVGSSVSSLLALSQRILPPILNPIVTLGLILLVTTFILIQKHDVRDRVIRLFAAGDLNRATAALNDAARLLSHYFLGKLAVNCAFGAVVGAGLVVIGVPSPALWGILGALLRFIPYFGSYLAAILPFLLAAAVGHGWSMALWTVVVFVGAELVLGNVVEPMLFGRTTGLSPLAVLLAAIFWAWAWGPVGLILSTPLTLCLVVLGRHVPALAFLDTLLGDRPALTPSENLYQRILAEDPDEAAGLAERFLEGHTLSEYYDEVVLKALGLAAADVAKGLLDRGQIERTKHAVGTLIQELEARKDALPPLRSRPSVLVWAHHTLVSQKRELVPLATPVPHSEWQGTSVLCVAGRGPLDDVVGPLLAQLLQKHGIGATCVTHDTVSRTNIAALETVNIRMVCLLYVELIGIPAHLRFVVRRLKERVPDAPVVVGFWSRQDSLFKDERMQKALGADHYVASLHEVLAICLAAAGRPVEVHTPELAALRTEAL